MRVLGKEMRELQWSDAQRAFEAELGAEHIAAEAAEMSEIVGLIETGALPEKLRDFPERQQCGKEQRHHHNPEYRDDHDPEALARRARRDEAEYHDQQGAERELSPGRARKRQEQSAQQYQHEQAVADHRGWPAHQDALEQQQAGKHQKSAEHVRIVEGGARSLVEQERIRQRRRKGGNRPRSR